MVLRNTKLQIPTNNKVIKREIANNMKLKKATPIKYIPVLNQNVKIGISIFAGFSSSISTKNGKVKNKTIPHRIIIIL